jgi:DNA topoisomerase-1
MPAKKSSLVIVESPTKAKTISKFLGKDYKVLSSFGHVRDLPKKELGIDTEHDFKPRYVVPVKSKKVASDLKKEAAKAESVYFASDEDREGEAIAWHLSEILKLKDDKAKRITFHEITKKAIDKALEMPRTIDRNLVDAQQARRVLDRLVGYKLSPFLWRKVARGLSAGRVQSVAVRLIVEREREIEAFKPQEYWTIEAELFKTDNEKAVFPARLHSLAGKPLDKFDISNADQANEIHESLKKAEWSVAKVEKKKQKRSPLAPYTTSTLQQDANNKLNFSAKVTMITAQQLYEGIEGAGDGSGLITYMRTDSVNLSDDFVQSSRDFIQANYGDDSLPEAARKFKNKSKSAQEAHEAVRPTDINVTPDSIKSNLSDRQYKLYDLIWRRATASQMADAELQVTTADILAKCPDQECGFRASGSIVVKEGYRQLYESDKEKVILPDLDAGQELEAKEVTPKQHFTEPPPRYSEASLVKSLEENAIGRPSTYAPIISTVVERGYVKKEGKQLSPTELAYVVTDLLVEHFPKVVDVAFTAGMEEQLDAIAEGQTNWVPVIRDFYEPFEKNLTDKEQSVPKRESEKAEGEMCEKCGKQMLIKLGRFGKFLACSGFPACRNSRPVPGAEPTAPGEENRTVDEKCEKCGAEMVIRRGRYGEFLSCSAYPQCKSVKPLQKKTGVKCPACKKGDIIEKRTRTGRLFYACSEYPKCDHALWNRPNGETCPECSALLVFAKGDKVKCSKKECTYEREVDK